MTISETTLDSQPVARDLVVSVNQVFRTFEQDTAPVRVCAGPTSTSAAANSSP
jgi:hypothetical protein